MKKPLPPGLTPRLLSREQAAAYLGISPNHFDRHVTQLTAIEIGSRRLYDIRALDALVDGLTGKQEYNPWKLLEAYDEPEDQGD